MLTSFVWADPTTNASRITERVTYSLEAPNARSNANSRTRWPSTIVNVLLIMNAATTTMTIAKANRILPKIATIVLNWSFVSWMVTSLVTASRRRRVCRSERRPDREHGSHRSSGSTTGLHARVDVGDHSGATHRNPDVDSFIVRLTTDLGRSPQRSSMNV